MSTSASSRSNSIQVLRSCISGGTWISGADGAIAGSSPPSSARSNSGVSSGGVELSAATSIVAPDSNDGGANARVT